MSVSPERTTLSAILFAEKFVVTRIGSLSSAVAVGVISLCYLAFRLFVNQPKLFVLAIAIGIP